MQDISSAVDPADPRGVLVVLTNLPDRASAESLAAALVDERLVACANILAPCRSVYRWAGKTETAEEIPVLLKTTTHRYAAVEAAIRQRHPYELPEILAFRPAAGLAAYLGWVVAETVEHP